MMQLERVTVRRSQFITLGSLLFSTSAVMPGFHHSVAVLPLPLRKFRKDSVRSIRITLRM